MPQFSKEELTEILDSAPQGGEPLALEIVSRLYDRPPFDAHIMQEARRLSQHLHTFFEGVDVPKRQAGAIWHEALKKFISAEKQNGHPVLENMPDLKLQRFLSALPREFKLFETDLPVESGSRANQKLLHYQKTHEVFLSKKESIEADIRQRYKKEAIDTEYSFHDVKMQLYQFLLAGSSRFGVQSFDTLYARFWEIQAALDQESSNAYKSSESRLLQDPSAIKIIKAQLAPDEKKFIAERKEAFELERSILLPQSSVQTKAFHPIIDRIATALYGRQYADERRRLSAYLQQVVGKMDMAFCQNTLFRAVEPYLIEQASKSSCPTPFRKRWEGALGEEHKDDTLRAQALAYALYCEVMPQAASKYPYAYPSLSQNQKRLLAAATKASSQAQDSGLDVLSQVSGYSIAQLQGLLRARDNDPWKQLLALYTDLSQEKDQNYYSLRAIQKVFALRKQHTSDPPVASCFAFLNQHENKEACYEEMYADKHRRLLTFLDGLYQCSAQPATEDPTNFVEKISPFLFREPVSQEDKERLRLYLKTSLDALKGQPLPHNHLYLLTADFLAMYGVEAQKGTMRKFPVGLHEEFLSSIEGEEDHDEIQDAAEIFMHKLFKKFEGLPSADFYPHLSPAHRKTLRSKNDSLKSSLFQALSIAERRCGFKEGFLSAHWGKIEKQSPLLRDAFMLYLYGEPDSNLGTVLQETLSKVSALSTQEEWLTKANEIIQDDFCRLLGVSTHELPDPLVLEALRERKRPGESEQSPYDLLARLLGSEQHPLCRLDDDKVWAVYGSFEEDELGIDFSSDSLNKISNQALQFLSALFGHGKVTEQHRKEFSDYFSFFVQELHKKNISISEPSLIFGLFSEYAQAQKALAPKLISDDFDLDTALKTLVPMSDTLPLPPSAEKAIADIWQSESVAYLRSAQDLLAYRLHVPRETLSGEQNIDRLAEIYKPDSPAANFIEAVLKKTFYSEDDKSTALAKALSDKVGLEIQLASENYKLPVASQELIEFLRSFFRQDQKRLTALEEQIARSQTGRLSSHSSTSSDHGYATDDSLSLSLSDWLSQHLDVCPKRPTENAEAYYKNKVERHLNEPQFTILAELLYETRPLDAPASENAVGGSLAAYMHDCKTKLANDAVYNAYQDSLAAEYLQLVSPALSPEKGAVKGELKINDQFAYPVLPSRIKRHLRKAGLVFREDILKGKKVKKALETLYNKQWRKAMLDIRAGSLHGQAHYLLALQSKVFEQFVKHFARADIKKQSTLREAMSQALQSTCQDSRLLTLEEFNAQLSLNFGLALGQKATWNGGVPAGFEDDWKKWHLGGALRRLFGGTGSSTAYVKRLIKQSEQEAPPSLRLPQVPEPPMEQASPLQGRRPMLVQAQNKGGPTATPKARKGSSRDKPGSKKKRQDTGRR